MLTQSTITTFHIVKTSAKNLLFIFGSTNVKNKNKSRKYNIHLHTNILNNTQEFYIILKIKIPFYYSRRPNFVCIHLQHLWDRFYIIWNSFLKLISNYCLQLVGRVLLDPRLGSNFGFHLMHYLAVKMYVNCIIIFILYRYMLFSNSRRVSFHKNIFKKSYILYRELPWSADWDKWAQSSARKNSLEWLTFLFL